MPAHAETNGNGKSVSKNWLIGIMGAIIAGLLTLGITQHLSANTKTEDSLKATVTEVTELKARINNIDKNVEDLRLMLGRITTVTIKEDKK